MDCEIERVRGRKRFRDSERERLRVREREEERVRMKKNLRQPFSSYRVQIEDQSHSFSYQLSVKMQTDRQKNGKKRVKYKKEEKVND